jgi:hypothetical protein
MELKLEEKRLRQAHEKVQFKEEINDQRKKKDQYEVENQKLAERKLYNIVTSEKTS